MLLFKLLTFLKSTTKKKRNKTFPSKPEAFSLRQGIVDNYQYFFSNKPCSDRWRGRGFFSCSFWIFKSIDHHFFALWHRLASKQSSYKVASRSHKCIRVSICKRLLSRTSPTPVLCTSPSSPPSSCSSKVDAGNRKIFKISQTFVQTFTFAVFNRNILICWETKSVVDLEILTLHFLTTPCWLVFSRQKPLRTPMTPSHRSCSLMGRCNRPFCTCYTPVLITGSGCTTQK